MRAARELRDQLAEIERGLAVAARPGLALFRLTGPDRVETLHRVVSQDVKTLQAGQGKLALLLAAKGQFRALMGVFAMPGELWLLAPVGHGDFLADSLRRYLAFSKSALEPVAPVRAPILLLGPRWAEVTAAAGAPVEALASGGMAVTDQAGEGVHWVGQTLVGVPGAVAFTPSDAAADSIELLARSLGATEVGGDAIELARIRLGFPAWGRELTETVLPPEVGIEALTISYSKGCYVGQETIARMRTHGHPNRRLVGVRQRDGTDTLPDLPGPLTVAGEEKPRGTLTSFALHPDLGGVGLALVRRELAGPGTVLLGAGRTFEITTFPLW